MQDRGLSASSAPRPVRRPARLGRPLHAASRSATVLAWSPRDRASSMRASSAASSTRASRSSGACAPRTITISPIHSRSSAARPAQLDRTNSSCTFVSSRATHAPRSGVASASSRSVAAHAAGRLEEHDRLRASRTRARSPRAARRRRAAGSRRSGSAPSPASPLATSAASTALAPGIGTTRAPRGDRGLDERLARIAHAGGPRVGHQRDPLAVRRAARRRAPRRARPRARRAARRACPRSRGARAAGASAACPRRRRDRTRASVSIARAVRSPRLPIGVATTKSVPSVAIVRYATSTASPISSRRYSRRRPVSRCSSWRTRSREIPNRRRAPGA